jgi:hypothetical protein
MLLLLHYFRKRDSNVFYWIKWIVEDRLLFNFCENEDARSYSKLEPISNTLLKQEMLKLTLLVEGKIKKIYPNQFALATDRLIIRNISWLSLLFS